MSMTILNVLPLELIILFDYWPNGHMPMLVQYYSVRFFLLFFILNVLICGFTKFVYKI